MNTNTILILNGSPRKLGNSAALAEQLAAGARSVGAQVETYFLQDMAIQPCNACDACQDSPENGCILEDDMQILYPKLRAAKAIIVATPIYWFNMSAQTKLCIDRWYALLDSSSGNALTGKQFAFLLSFGDSDLFTSGGINAVRTFQDMCRYLKAEIAGFVYGSASEAGEIKVQTELIQQAYQLGEKLGR